MNNTHTALAFAGQTMTGGNKLSASRLGFQHPKGDRGDGTQLKQYARASGSFSGGGLWVAAGGREGLACEEQEEDFSSRGRSSAKTWRREQTSVLTGGRDTHRQSLWRALWSPLRCISPTHLFLRSKVVWWLRTRALVANGLGSSPGRWDFLVPTRLAELPTLSFLTNGAANSFSL